MEKQEAARIIAAKVEQATALIRECEAIADSENVEFAFSISYGMGGTYTPKDPLWDDSGCSYKEEESTTGVWNASSQSC